MQFTVLVVLMMTLSGFQYAYATDAAPAETPAVTKVPAYDTSLIVGTITSDDADVGSSKPSAYCSVYGGKDVDEGDKVVVVGEVECNDTYPTRRVDFYEIMISGKTYYTKKENVLLNDEDKKRFESLPPSALLDLKQNAMEVFQYIRKKELKEAFNAIEKTKKHGLTLIHNSIFKTSEYTEGTGFKVTVFNPTNKVIKYIHFTVIGYNAVKDPVPTIRAKKKVTSITVKGIGPIPEGQSGSYNWDYMWFTDLVQTHKLTSIKIEYMDGSKRTINNLKDIKLAQQYVDTLSEED
jgi:hypothetical protein